ncbi:MAG: hypothetical protein Q4C55_00950 [Eubacterium sp.]|nr:hypothetical protein [Eubacterium sp.]
MNKMNRSENYKGESSMKVGKIVGYWPIAADETAVVNGYKPVSQCEADIAAGLAGPCHSGAKGLVDYGIAEWLDDDLVSINGKRVLSDIGPLLLEDAIFTASDLHLWKSDASVLSDHPEDEWLCGVCGLEIDPDESELILFKDITSMHEDKGSKHLILTLRDGTEITISLSPEPGSLFNLSSRTKRRHQRALRIMQAINEHR